MEIENMYLTIIRKTYEREIVNGNTSHIRDLVGIKVVQSLGRNKRNLPNITLEDLISKEPIRWFQIPDIDRLEERKKRLDVLICDPTKKPSVIDDMINERAAIIWILGILEIEELKEREVICPAQYKLKHYIMDPKLREVLKFGGNETLKEMGRYQESKSSDAEAPKVYEKTNKE